MGVEECLCFCTPSLSFGGVGAIASNFGIDDVGAALSVNQSNCIRSNKTISRDYVWVVRNGVAR